MKKLLTCLTLLFILFSVSAQQQEKQTKKELNVEITKDGNYVQKTSTSTSVKTDKTFTDKEGKVYPVYQSSNGNLYVNRISKKTGKEYKYYLKTK